LETYFLSPGLIQADNPVYDNVKSFWSNHVANISQQNHKIHPEELMPALLVAENTKNPPEYTVFYSTLLSLECSNM
jgi:hypothetical protein